MRDRALPRDPGRRLPELTGRWRAGLEALRARAAARRALREEQRALVDLGLALAGPTVPGGAGVRCALAEIAAHDSAIAELEASLSASLQDDRADYRAVSSWMRPVVIARGLAARCVLRHRLRRARSLRLAACGRAGAAALDESPPMHGEAAALAGVARDARARASASSARAEESLAPYGGSALPAVSRHASREAMAFGRTLFKEVRGQIVPRVPALAGLVVGWWVASTFTDSRFSAALHSLGIGSGPRRAVSSDTYKAMTFWLPVLAAALCSYGSARLAALVRSRYSTLPSEVSRRVLVDHPASRAAEELAAQGSRSPRT